MLSIWTSLVTHLTHSWRFRPIICAQNGRYRTRQCEASPVSSHSGWVSLGTLLVPLPRRTITVSLPPHLDPLQCWLEEAGRSPENYLAEDNRWWSSVLELRGPHGLKEGKRCVRLPSSSQYGNPPLWRSPIKKQKMATFFTNTVPFRGGIVNDAVWDTRKRCHSSMIWSLFGPSCRVKIREDLSVVIVLACPLASSFSTS